MNTTHIRKMMADKLFSSGVSFDEYKSTMEYIDKLDDLNGITEPQADETYSDDLINTDKTTEETTTKSPITPYLIGGVIGLLLLI